MHRNTFIFSPALLRPTLQYHNRDDLFFAGQIIGVEGYAGNIATGLLAGWNAARVLQNRVPLIFPRETMLGALCDYVTHATAKDFQPMKAIFGILPPLEDGVERGRRGRRERSKIFVDRGAVAMNDFLKSAQEN
jgi:methylenetetrahydrofolate--tRNA-(uracil-5-)-methyltransferase